MIIQICRKKIWQKPMPMHKGKTQKNRNRGELHQLDKQHWQNPTANVILVGKLRALLQKSTRWGYPLSPLTHHSEELQIVCPKDSHIES
jgi:hypothetical protein